LLRQNSTRHSYTGYRPRCTFAECINSLLWLHNESFNCWSHILGIPMVLLFFREELGFSFNPVMLLYLSTALCFVLGSSFAHTFCCYYRLSHNASFVVDYIGLTIFSCGAGIAYVNFSFPLELRVKSGLFGLSFLDTYLVFLCLCSAMSIFLSVWTRTLRESFLRSILRVSAFASPGFFMSLPVLYKLLACSFDNNNYPANYCDSTALWSKQFIASITTIFFYVSRFPERLCPGKFDYFGHSHNVFHVGGLLALYYQKSALSLDARFARSHQFSTPSMELPVLCISFLLLSIISACIYFRRLFVVNNSKPSH
uniref:Progestin and adipoQ receptor family member VI n=1 Tax=Mesocestoides corti TaxID=53468 RepID=A0A0R3UQ39_MESCO